MGGNFHNYIIHTFSTHDGQRVLQFHHIGSRIMNGEYFFLHHYLNGTDKPHLVAGLAQNGTDKVTGRGFAVSTRNTDYPHIPGRIIMEKRHDNIQSRL